MRRGNFTTHHSPLTTHHFSSPIRSAAPCPKGRQPWLAPFPGRPSACVERRGTAGVNIDETRPQSVEVIEHDLLLNDDMRIPGFIVSTTKIAVDGTGIDAPVNLKQC